MAGPADRHDDDRDDSGDVDALFALVLSGCGAAHQKLLDTVAATGLDAVGRPSLLPDWTVGHVLTHLARNADSHTRMLEAAARGEHVEQYPGGHEQRADDIATGAQRAPAVIVADLEEATAALEASWAAMPDGAWDGWGLSMGRPWPCRQIVFHRWREVELHHADLGLGYGPADWPEDYVALELPLALEQLPRRLDEGGRHALFAWLVGRGDAPMELELAPWQTVSYQRGPWPGRRPG